MGKPTKHEQDFLAKLERLLDIEQQLERRMKQIKQKLGATALVLNGEELNKAIIRYRREYKAYAKEQMDLRKSIDEIFNNHVM